MGINNIMSDDMPLIVLEPVTSSKELANILAMVLPEDKRDLVAVGNLSQEGYLDVKEYFLAFIEIQGDGGIFVNKNNIVEIENYRAKKLTEE